MLALGVDPRPAIPDRNEHIVRLVSLELITSSRCRSVTDVMASMPLMIRLTITCWSWTLSPSTGGSRGESRSCNDTR